MPNVQITRARTNAFLPTTLGWFIPQIFGRYPPKIIPVYTMRKVTDAHAQQLVDTTDERIRAWLERHIARRYT